MTEWLGSDTAPSSASPSILHLITNLLHPSLPLHSISLYHFAFFPIPKRHCICLSFQPLSIVLLLFFFSDCVPLITFLYFNGNVQDVQVFWYCLTRGSNSFKCFFACLGWCLLYVRMEDWKLLCQIFPRQMFFYLFRFSTVFISIHGVTWGVVEVQGGMVTFRPPGQAATGCCLLLKWNHMYTETSILKICMNVYDYALARIRVIS